MKVPNNDEQIIKEVEASIRLRDIKEWNDLHEALTPTYMEFIIRALMFTTSLGLMLTLIFALPQENETAYYIWLFWGCGAIGVYVFSIDFLMRKYRVMRRVIEIQNHQLEVYERLTKITGGKETKKTEET